MFKYLDRLGSSLLEKETAPGLGAVGPDGWHVGPAQDLRPRGWHAELGMHAHWRWGLGAEADRAGWVAADRSWGQMSGMPVAGGVQDQRAGAPGPDTESTGP